MIEKQTTLSCLMKKTTENKKEEENIGVLTEKEADQHIPHPPLMVMQP